MSWSTPWKLYKDVFKGDAPTNLAVRRKAALSRIKRVDDLEGVKSIYPVRVHTHVGPSHTLTDSIDNDTANDIYRFEIQAKDSFGVVKFIAKDMAMARSNMGSYLRYKAKEIEDVLEYMGQRMEKEIWRGTSLGSVTAAPSNVAGSTYLVTLADPSDIINFHAGQVIECWDTADASSATQRAEECVVTKINHKSGTFEGTFTGNPSAWGTNTDYLFVEGDRTGTSIKGWTSIADYNPATAPSSSDSFLSTNRSNMPDFLAGWRGDEFPTVEETVQQLCTTMSGFIDTFEGGTECWLNPKAFQKLQSEAGARLVRDPGQKALLGYTKAAINTAFGEIGVYTTPYLSKNVVRLIDWRAVSLHTNRALVHLVNEDGNEMVRKATEDSFEMRWRSWSEVLVDEPVRLGNAPITV